MCMFIKVAPMHSFIHGFDHSPHALCEVVVLQYTILVLYERDNQGITIFDNIKNKYLCENMFV